MLISTTNKRGMRWSIESEFSEEFMIDWKRGLLLELCFSDGRVE